MRWGVPYVGSKSAIVGKIVDVLPERKVLYDLFSGGCSMADYCIHRTSKFKVIHSNDLNPLPIALFKQAVSGNIPNLYRWVSRDEFFTLKDEDPLVRYIWSFGNRGDTYLYGKQIEEYKKAYHYAVAYNNPTPLLKYGYDVAKLLDGVADVQERRLIVKRHIENIDGDSYKSHLENIERLQALERIKPTFSNGFGLVETNKPELMFSCGSYADVDFVEPKECVLYCDIPYDCTMTANYLYGNDFEREDFLNWCVTMANKGYEIYISEYNITDERFKCVAEFDKRNILCATANIGVVERLYTPKQNQRIKEVYRWETSPLF